MAPNEQESLSLPGPADIAAVLKFLPIFEKPGFEFSVERGGERQPDGVITMPYVELSGAASHFYTALNEHGFILKDFAWPDWQYHAQLYVSDPSALETADLETLCKLLTTHVRKDRFCDGHLAQMFECGHLTQILRRMSHFAG